MYVVRVKRIDIKNKDNMHIDLYKHLKQINFIVILVLTKKKVYLDDRQ